jgi:hypothetical protein
MYVHHVGGTGRYTTSTTNMYHQDRFHVPCFAASVHFFRGHRQITDAHDWIVEQQDADQFQKIEKSSVSIDHTRHCIQT